MTDGDRPSTDLPIAEPTEVEPRASRSRTRRRFAVAVVAVIAVAALAIPIALRTSGPSPTHRSARRTTKHVDPHQARVAVGAALAATLSSRSYHASNVMDVTGGTSGTRITAEATINLDPLAMVATATLGGSAQYSSWTDGTRQWEAGGANYGLNGGSGLGAGQPISGFNSLVVSTLGRREGGVAMMSLSSPAGYFDLADQAITSAAQVGTTSSDGADLTEYAVTIDAAQLVHRSGMTAEQVKAATVAIDELQQEGYRDTAVRLSVDTAGYVRVSHAQWRFADGGAVTTDTVFSNYNCAGTVTLPMQAPAPPPAPTCTSSDTTPVTADSTPATSNTAGTSPATSNTVAQKFVPATPATIALSPDTTATAGSQPDAFTQIAYAYAHFFDPALTADQRAALIQGSTAMRAWIDASFNRHRAEVAQGAVITDEISVNGDTADVSFHALLGKGESPANPGEIHGTAVLEDGTWKISRVTYCTLSANDGEVCPAA